MEMAYYNIRNIAMPYCDNVPDSGQVARKQGCGELCKEVTGHVDAVPVPCRKCELATGDTLRCLVLRTIEMQEIEMQATMDRNGGNLPQKLGRRGERQLP